jgi:hypothetical protein
VPGTLPLSGLKPDISGAGGTVARMRKTLRFALVCLASCATIRPPDVEELKPAIERIHTRLRWKDFRGAADLIVPERRTSFIKARTKLKDERDLFISDYQLEDARLSPDLQSASVVSHMSWYRLPSNSEQTVTITSVFVWRENVWMLESQDDGPFEELKPAPESAPAPKPGESVTKTQP